MFKKSRKGITPVIAIVLLLLITVGAVGVVYSQFQNLTGDPSEQLAQQQRVQNTELTFSSVYKDTSDDDSINISLRNTGSVTLNMTEQFEISFVPENSDSGVSYQVLPGSYKASGNQECFTSSVTNGNREMVEPGGTYICDTGVAFPAATDSVGIVVSFRTADKSWSYTCAPSTSGSLSC